MGKILQDKKMLMIAALLVLLLLGGGGYYVMNMQKTAPVVEEAETEEEMVVETLEPSDIGMDFEFRKDGKAGRLIIGNAKGIKTIEYQLSYQKELEGEEVPEGLIGDLMVEGEDSIKTEFREFGTCSSGKCRYDNVTSPIKVTLKITKEDGKVYQSEKSFDLPS